MFAISTENIEKCLLANDLTGCIEENVEDEKISCEAFTYDFEGTGSIDDSIMSSYRIHMFRKSFYVLILVTI